MPYVYLFLAIAAEVCGTSLLKLTHGFTRVLPTSVCVVAYVLSFVFLAQTVRSIPVGVTYAVWSGLGTVLIVAIATAFLGEPLDWTKVLGVGFVVAGVVLLNLRSAH